MNDLRFAPARIGARAQEFDPTALLNLAKKSALDSTVFDDEGRAPFFFRAEISNNSLDSYETRMTKLTLENFVRDAKAGVSILDNHNSRRLGLGRSLDAQLEQPTADSYRVISDAYLLPGISTPGASYGSTDDFIRSIRSGIAFDISVGFHGGEERCSICNASYYSWDCSHIAGREYEERDETTGAVIAKQRAFVWIDGATLSEFSPVFDGATPGAGILKAERMIGDGRLKDEIEIRSLERQYRTKFALPSITLKSSKEERTVMDKEQIIKEGLRAALTQAGITEAGDELEIIKRLAGENSDLRTAKADSDKQIAELTRATSDVVAIRAEVEAEAHKQAVRALGEDYSEDKMITRLAKLDVVEIREMTAEYQKAADKHFLSGRQSTPEAEIEAAPIVKDGKRAIPIPASHLG